MDGFFLLSDKQVTRISLFS